MIENALVAQPYPLKASTHYKWFGDKRYRCNGWTVEITVLLATSRENRCIYSVSCMFQAKR